MGWNNSYKVVEINGQVCELSTCTCQYWRKHYICKRVIGVRKKASSALNINSTYPLNQAAFNKPTQSNSNIEQSETRPVLDQIKQRKRPSGRP